MNTDAVDLLQVGEDFRGYVVERLLGKGGLGAVYLVRHAMLDTLYARKVIFGLAAVAAVALILLVLTW